MKILVAEHYGFCFGVRDAVKQAEDLAQSGPVTILGALVHNPVALERLEARGAATGKLDDLASAQGTQRVLITAHGASDERRRQWVEAGFTVSDATCPLVRRAHQRLAGLVASGYFPVVIGQAGHVEVLGLTGDFPGAAVLGSEADISDLPAHRRYGVIAQTTQPLARVMELVAAVKAARPAAEVKYCDTVCQPTKDRQASVQRLAAEAEVVIIVGGRLSNNTRQLVHAVETAGRRAHQIERPEELQPEWLAGVGRVGLTAGTSTLPETVDAVRRRLEQIAAAATS